LAGCTTVPLIPPSATTTGAQADASLDALYNVAATAYEQQLPTMSSSVKATVKPLLVKAYPLVVAADKAEALGDATTLAAQISAATALIVQAKTALGISQ
jgi:hypothetical protein